MGIARLKNGILIVLALVGRAVAANMSVTRIPAILPAT
jgi:hypothetical protein